MGRPKKAANDQKNSFVKVRETAERKAEMQALAKKYGFTDLSAMIDKSFDFYVHWLRTGKELQPVPGFDGVDVMELNRWGTNLNQSAKALNEIKYTVPREFIPAVENALAQIAEALPPIQAFVRSNLPKL